MFGFCNISALLLLFGVCLAELDSIAHSTLVDKSKPFPHIPGVNKGDSWARFERLAAASRIATESYDVGKCNDTAFPLMHKFLQHNFPLAHGASWVKREVVNNYSLLYTITGTNTRVMPYSFDTHMDVVPASAAGWTYPPYAGVIVNDTENNWWLYGRGVLDTKGSMMGIFEALEYMVSLGEQPVRSFFITIGHDEEVGGSLGNKVMAQALRDRGVRALDFLVDEGMPLTDGLIPGVLKPVALVGVSEKGFIYATLTVTRTPSHSSIPSWETSIGILANALAKLENKKVEPPMSAGLGVTTLERLQPYCDDLHKMYYSDVSRYRTEITAEFQVNQVTNAMLRTTTALTIVQGGSKENVVPGVASAVVNFRIHPSQTVAEITEFMRATIGDPRVAINITRSFEAHPQAPYAEDNQHWQMVTEALKQSFPESVSTPAVTVANTNARYYLDMTSNVYRVFPTIIGSKDVGGIHGYNERTTEKNYRAAVDFYYRIIKFADHVWSSAPTVP